VDDCHCLFDRGRPSNVAVAFTTFFFAFQFEEGAREVCLADL
jgi:hypothetical protein